MLGTEELLHYSRHLLLPEIGREGQERLKAASALVVGAGGLGSPLALYLAAAGVGRLGLVEFDTIETTNLHRQVLYAAADVGKPKLEVAVSRLRAANPHIEVLPFNTPLTRENAVDIVRAFDVVADGTDNFPTRYLVNDACVLTGVPNVYASIYRFDGQVSVFGLEGGPCYRCLYPEPPPPGLVPSCATGGVLGVLPGIVGALQAAEVIKVLLGIGEPLSGRLLLADVLSMQFQEMGFRRNAACPVCGDEPTITAPIDYDAFCGVPARDVPVQHRVVPGISAQKLAALDTMPILLDVRQPEEGEIASLGGLLIPLADLPSQTDELAEHLTDDIVVYCRTGVRSAEAVRLLLDRGFKAVRHLEGGLHAWSQEVDPAIPQY